MNNKYLVTITIPELELNFDLYIPNNKKIGTIKKKIINSLYDMTKQQFKKNENEVKFVDRNTGIELQNNLYVKNSGIKNGTKILIL